MYIIENSINVDEAFRKDKSYNVYPTAMELKELAGDSNWLLIAEGASSISLECEDGTFVISKYLNGSAYCEGKFKDIGFILDSVIWMFEALEDENDRRKNYNMFIQCLTSYLLGRDSKSAFLENVRSIGDKGVLTLIEDGIDKFDKYRLHENEYYIYGVIE